MVDLFETTVFPRPSNYKIMLIILDGLADVPVDSLGNKTPLEYANKPNLDELAKRDVKALVVACNTSTAVALRDLRARYDLPVLRVVRPGAALVEQGDCPR